MVMEMSKINMELFRFEDLIQSSKEELSNCQNELKSSPQGFLSLHKQQFEAGRKKCYRHCVNDGKNKKQILLAEDDPMIGALARKKFLENKTEILKSNVHILEKTSLDYVDPLFTNVVSTMTKVYSTLDQKTFLSNMSRESIAWMNEPYEQADNYKSHNKIPTFLGIKVKSKSERDILEALLSFGIPVRYEEVIYIGRYRIAPDFACLNPVTTQRVYWEHCGMMDNPEYRRSFRWKIDQFEKAGIYPGKNLILTFEGDGQFLSTAEINEIIKSKIL